MSFHVFIKCEDADSDPVLFVQGQGVRPNIWYMLCRGGSIGKYTTPKRDDIYLIQVMDKDNLMLNEIPPDAWEFCNTDEAFQVAHQFLLEHSLGPKEPEHVEVRVTDIEWVDKNFKLGNHTFLDYRF